MNRIAVFRSLCTTTLIVGVIAVGPSCSDPYDETGPSDEISAGQLCTPAAVGCPSSTDIHRTSDLGANRVDFQLVNQGADARVTVFAQLPDQMQSDDAGADADGFGRPRPNPDRLDAGGRDAAADIDAASTSPGVLLSRDYTLAAGESIVDRFSRDSLFTRPVLHLGITCDGCRARLEFTVGSAPLECRADDDCGGDWLCNQDDGRCVECLADSDCATDQSCSSTTQQCTPVEAAGCRQAKPSDDSRSVPVGLLFLAAGLMGLAARRKPCVLASTVVVGALLSVAPNAQANPPRAGISLGAGSRLLTGQMGKFTNRGIGLTIAQELRGDHVGGRVQLGASYFLTSQPSPPLSRELQLYSVAIGPQVYLPVGPTTVALGVDYRHIGLVSNSLVRLTGPAINHQSVGGTAEVRYQTAPITWMIRGGFHPIFGLDGAMVTIDLAIGLSTGQ